MFLSFIRYHISRLYHISCPQSQALSWKRSQKNCKSQRWWVTTRSQSFPGTTWKRHAGTKSNCNFMQNCIRSSLPNPSMNVGALCEWLFLGRCDIQENFYLPKKGNPWETKLQLGEVFIGVINRSGIEGFAYKEQGRPKSRCISRKPVSTEVILHESWKSEAFCIVCR